ncbi:hypothetical protein LCGC14_2517880 [marine sediment metagenome]|uniref:Uncharacterized protein n=1 Tax=marine sediment metagenome TaxID=412755 RepID=A0A0F9AXW0_9ZZZZ
MVVIGSRTVAEPTPEESRMKKMLTSMLLLIVLTVGTGCSGVIMNARYSELLDRTVVLSDVTATDAEAGELSGDQMIEALRDQADIWRKFQDARDGRANE